MSGSESDSNFPPNFILFSYVIQNSKKRYMSDNFLRETTYFDYSEPEVQSFVNSLDLDGKTPREKAITLYYGVRDGFRYNAYNISFDTQGLPGKPHRYS